MTLALLMVCCASQSLRPPMHRAWTYPTGDLTRVLAVRQGVAYYTSRAEVGALQVESGKTVWTQKVGWGHPSAINDDTMFVLDQREDGGTVLAFGLKDGARRTVAAVKGSLNSIEADNKHVYLIPDKGEVTAMDVATGKKAWSWKLPTALKDNWASVSSAVGAGKLFIAISEDSVNALDAKTGIPAWHHKPDDAYLHDLRVTEYGLHVPGVGMLALADGKPLWPSEYAGHDLKGLVGGVAVLADQGRYIGVDARNGKKLWEAGPTAKDRGVSSGREALGVSLGNELLVSTVDATIIDKGGNVIWSGEPFFSGTPVTVVGRTMLCEKGERLLGYVPGAPAAIPADAASKKAMAEKMVAEFEQLDDAEVKQLTLLAPYVAKPLLKRYVVWIKQESKDEDSSMSSYQLRMDADRVLAKTSGPSDTEDLLLAIRELGPDDSSSLKRILGEKGEPGRTAAVFLEELKANRHKDGRDADAREALTAVAESRDPAAVAYMIEILKDTTAPDEWRHQAFTHLVATGGDAGLAAVRAARATRQAVPTWQQRFAKEEKQLKQATDAQGRIWRLSHSPALGNGSDLFIQSKTADGWSAPVFTGFYTSRTWELPEPTEYHGIPVDKLLAGEWVKAFTTDPTLTKDSDGDGLTDLVEARLGTNPNEKDSDHDGLDDAVDPCPNAAPRTLGDREKIIAACIEARFFARPYDVPTTLEVKGVKPFEFYGYGDTVLWTGDGYKGTLPKMYNTGVNTIGFSPPYERDAAGRSRDEDWLKIEPDGKHATTSIARYSGGLNGDGSNVKLVKVGDDWFVTEIQLMIVS